MATAPPAPENVVVTIDDRRYPTDCTYVGLHQGQHTWETVTTFDIDVVQEAMSRGAFKIDIAKLPAQTSVTVKTAFRG
jgi:hypothetical protein